MNDDELRFESKVAELYRRPVPLDPAARERLDRALHELPPVRARGWLSGLLAPRSLSLSPIGALAVLLLVLAAGIAIGRGAWSTRERPSPALVAEAPDQVVQFVVVARGASSVAVVGDFNGWDASAHPMLRAHDGDTWTVSVPVSVGHHVYSFVIDGSRWMPDPVAPLAPEDEFGIRNSVIVVGGRET